MTLTQQSSAPVATPASVQQGSHRPPTAREKAFNIAVWILFTVLWVAFFAALLTNQAILTDLWHQIRDLSLIIQGLLLVLFLPLMAGLAIWDASWSPIVRLVLIVGIAGFNLYLFFPWKGVPK